MKISKKTEERLLSALPRFQAVLKRAVAADLNESDTVIIITDMLAEVFGYEKYTEITSELAIRGTYCDLAIKLASKYEYLIECKSVGMDLKEAHIRQAVNYGANKGIQWIILTNGIEWMLYRLRFEQPIAYDLIIQFNILALNPKDASDIQPLYAITKEGVEKSARDEMHEKKQCINRYMVGAVLLSESVVHWVCKQLRRISDGVKVSEDEILAIIREECLRRDLTECEEGVAAAKRFNQLVPPAAKPPPKPRTKASETAPAPVDPPPSAATEPADSPVAPTEDAAS